MADVISIDLRDAIPKRGAIQFVRAEVPRHSRSSLALVRYSRRGVEQTSGRRLDLDKQVFLDQIAGDPEAEAAFKWAAPQIVSHVSRELRRRLTQSA